MITVYPPRLCPTCRLVQPRAARCSICGVDTWAIDDRPPALFPPSRRQVQMGPKLKSRLTRLLLLAAFGPLALIGFLEDGDKQHDYFVVLAFDLTLVILIFGLVILVELVRERRRAERAPGHLIPLTALPVALEPSGPASLRGTARWAAESHGPGLLSALLVHPTEHPRQILLRCQQGGEFRVLDTEGAPHLVTGVVHLLPGDDPGEVSDARAIDGWPIDSLLPTFGVRAHRLHDGDFVEVWGEPHTEQRLDGYRDIALSVLRGVPGRPVLVRRVVARGVPES